MKLEAIAANQSLTGVEVGQVVTVVATVAVGEARQLIYRLPDGSLRDRLLTPSDAAAIDIAVAHRPWSFEGDAAAFQLTCEAKRIDLAFLFDPMMAVHTSNVDPLPHQITAVYESMLPRQPLRFVLADDPGAGKTIMAGLYIRELLLRADARRILIVAPGSLVEQWRDELHEKFGLQFQVYASDLDGASPSGNAFADHHQLIIRLDQASRNEDLQDRLCSDRWDLVIFDEAHKLAAHYFGSKLEKTGRFRLAEKLGAYTRHLLLMTATPHNGKEEDFQLFLSLLDSDRFYGKFRDGVHKVDTSDLMRRMVKEELVKFDGTPLFPERKAYTVNYTLSPAEAVLYEDVTRYVSTEMGKADQLQGSRKGSVGFALTALQRRLASSPEAIYQSLRRRRERLEARLREDKLAARGRLLAADAPLRAVPVDDDDLDAFERETLEETLVDDATAASTIAELEHEIATLHDLEGQARDLVASGQDRKWDELSKLLQHDARMHKEGAGAAQRMKKLIIFSEHRDTLNYLQRKITGVLGSEAAVVTIHGGTHRDERRKIQAEFRSNDDIRVLVATDAAGEGVNLQNANLMVNYDLPWNPNRLEQRFGRVHRIGQTEVCHLWNLVAAETREGQVYHRLLQKLATESDALAGRVFDILGKVFEDQSLKDLLVEAIRYGDRDDVRQRLNTVIDKALDQRHLKSLLDNDALAEETLGPERLFAVKEEMDKAEARKLQPLFVRAFFEKAFTTLGGTMHKREQQRFEITYVPEVVRERDRLITGRNRRSNEPVLKKYGRVCFEKRAIHPAAESGKTRPDRALLLHPGHPLMLAMTDLLLERNTNLLREGAVLIDPRSPDEAPDATTEPWLLVLLTHEVKSGDGLVLSKRLQFVRVSADGTSTFAGWAPHLDLDPLLPEDRPDVEAALAAEWLKQDLERSAIALAATTLVPAHFEEVATRRVEYVNKTLNAVHERLTREINFWSDRWLKLKEDLDLGKDVRLNVDMASRTIAELNARLESRRRELEAARHVTNGTPAVLGAALVVPAHMVSRYRAVQVPEAAASKFDGSNPPGDQFDVDASAIDGAFDKMTEYLTPYIPDGTETHDVPPPPPSEPYEIDPEARKRSERLATAAVRKAEEARGCKVVDVSADKCGWDLTSYPPKGADGRDPLPRHIEIKGRLAGQSTICVTRNEIFYALNQADKFVLAIVLIDEHDDDKIEGPYYLHKPFDREPPWGVASMNYNVKDLLARTSPW